MDDSGTRAVESGHGHGCGCPGCAGHVHQPGPAAGGPTAMAAGPSLAAMPAGGLTFAMGGDPTAAMTAAAVSFLQRSAGNTAVNAIMRRRAAADGPVLARRGIFGGAENEQERYEDAIQEKQEYIADGLHGPEDFQSSTGIGGFNVSYDPNGWEQKVTLRGAVNFLDGMTFAGGVATAVQPHANAQTAANNINAMAANLRAAAVAGWQWDEAAKTAFLARFQQVVMSVWSGRHIFHCSRQYWEDVAAIPNVSAEVHAGEKTGDDHMAMSVYRVPPNFTGGVGVVNSGGGILGFGAATDNTMTLNSNDVEQRKDDILNVQTTFVAGGTAIDPSATAALNQFAIRFRSGGPVCSICGNAIEAVGGVAITAAIEGEGADPEANARARFDALSAALVAGGMTDAATRLQFSYRGPAGTTGYLTVGSGVPQMVAAHEAGHMFGLGDRYATTAGSGIGGTGPSVGLPSKHDDLARGGGLGDAKAANDDGIMSWGNEVRPADYATFLEALKDVSGIDEWAFGPPQAVVPPPGAVPAGGGGTPSGPGDFPTPRPNPPTAVA
jgi:hypothetical protein